MGVVGLGALSAVGAMVFGSWLLGAPAAHASTTDENEYLGRVHEALPVVYSHYSNQALLNEGYRICGYEARGMDTSDETDLVVAEMPMSHDAAIHLEVISTVWLGC
jgi:hypothetical protein